MTELILIGDALEKLKEISDGTVDCCVTSPPYYGLRDYGIGGQVGLEQTPEEYVRRLVKIFREVWRVLKDDGTLWLNLGDSYGTSGGDTHSGFNERYFGRPSSDDNKQDRMLDGIKTHKKSTGLRPKNLLGIPWRVALALQSDGWYLRQDIIWHKPNPMPESVKDRCTKSHEYIFLLSKNRSYFFDHNAIREPCSEASIRDFKRRKTMNNKGAREGTYHDARPDLTRSRENYYSNDFMRNKRSVWTISAKPYKGAHFAVFPPDLIEPCVLAGSREGGIVLDPFMGSGTTCMVAKQHGRGYIGIELNPEYVELAKKRIHEGTKDGKQISMAI